MDNKSAVVEVLSAVFAYIIVWGSCLWFAVEVILPWIVRVIKVTWEGA